MADKDKIDQELADAGWETDEPTYELYDVGRHVSYWVHEVPTPEQAARLLEGHGEPSKEE